MNVSDEFTLLTAFGAAPVNDDLRTRDIGINVIDGALLLGLDAGGSRHLLIPASQNSISEDLHSTHVQVRERVLVDQNGVNSRYVDLVCFDSSLFRVYEQLVEDVLSRLDVGVSANIVCQAALGDWRELLRGNSGNITRSKAIGLYGELFVLGLLAAQDPLGALEAWIGPTGAAQDFYREGYAIEVKTTAGADASRVRVSSLDQLDPMGFQRLDLIVLHVREDEFGDSLDEMIERILRLGVSRHALLSAVRESGYTFGSLDPHSYSVRSCRSWHVGEDFPSIRATDIALSKRTAITNVRYDLAVTMPATGTCVEEIQALLQTWAAR